MWVLPLYAQQVLAVVADSSCIVLCVNHITAV